LITIQAVFDDLLGSKTKDKSSGKHQFQWWDVPWVHFSETTSENRDRRL
jgi:hypothetical protein